MILPIVMRELKVQARQPRIYRLRLTSGILGTILIGNILLSQGTGARLQDYFIMVAIASFIYVLGTGERLTVDCITEERRNDTLGFLFLTHLKGYDVVLGKLAAHAIPALQSMMAFFPVLALCLLVGGLSAGLLFRFMISLLNALFFSLAVGIAASAMVRTRTGAEWLAALVLGVTYLILPFAGLMAMGFRMNTTSEVLFLFSPVPGFEFWSMAAPAGRGVTRTTVLGSFWFALAFNHAMAWLILAFAGARLGRSWREGSPPRARSWRDNVRQWQFGNPDQRRALRRHCLTRNPFYWLAARSRWPAQAFWWMLGMTAAFTVWLVSQVRWDEGLTVAMLMGSIAWYVVPKILVASGASKQLATERQLGTLELILSTPLSVPEICRGQWLGLWRHYGVLVAAGLILQVATILRLTLSRGSGITVDVTRDLLPIMIGSVVVYLLDLWTIAWLGMWYGLSSGNPQRAGSSVVRSVLFLPGLLFCAGLLMAQFSWVYLGHRVPLDRGWLLAAWFGLSVACDFFWVRWAQNHLRREFRTVAAQPLGKPGGVGAWGRWLGEWWIRERRPSNKPKRTPLPT